MWGYWAWAWRSRSRWYWAGRRGDGRGVAVQRAEAIRVLQKRFKKYDDARLELIKQVINQYLICEQSMLNDILANLPHDAGSPSETTTSLLRDFPPAVRELLDADTIDLPLLITKFRWMGTELTKRLKSRFQLRLSSYGRVYEQIFGTQMELPGSPIFAVEIGDIDDRKE